MGQCLSLPLYNIKAKIKRHLGGYMGKIVFSDIDGTLLDNNHRMLDSSYEAIKKLQKQDIPFVIVTARGPMGVYPIFKRYKFICPMVCYSGALIIGADGEIVYSNGFSKDTAKAIISFLDKEKLDCTWNIYTMDSWIVNNRRDARVAREEAIVEAASTEGDVDMLSDGAEVGKLLCMCNPKDTDEIEAKLRKKFPGLSIVRSSDILIEVMNKGITKGKSIEFLCEKWDIDIKDTVAFGDHYNDVDMLETVGHPFLMDNAPDELKTRITNVTYSNEADGIYYGLKQLGMIE